MSEVVSRTFLLADFELMATTFKLQTDFMPRRSCIWPLKACILLAFLHLWLATAVSAPDWLIDSSSFRASVTVRGNDIVLSNGLIQRVIRIAPAAATIAFDHLVTGESLLRATSPEGEIQINGRRFLLGGFTGQPVNNFLKPEWLNDLTPATNSQRMQRFEIDGTRARFPWNRRVEWLSRQVDWPPPGKALSLVFADTPEGAEVAVHYEIYDGLPLISKWITIKNNGLQPFEAQSVIVEQLPVVEPESIVDGSPANFRRNYSSLEVFSDYSFGGNMTANADSPGIRWKSDPQYPTQVHYERKTPCLIECSTPMGPNVILQPGQGFESLRAFELAHDSTDRERRGLTARRAYRLLSPWVQENPILMHVRSAKPEAVRLAIDQCAAVGFEMVIMTFGSGFNIENEAPAYLEEIRELADYGRSKNIALGGYSLLASRSIDAENDAINPDTGRPGGMRFGNSPCLGSSWGTNYFRALRRFYEQTGCAVLEHDGSYPGDVCASTAHPGHSGLLDSQWQQWQVIAQFYRWCRSEGIYLNVPDWYYLSGSSKCGMGYRESNWSLPREEQEIIERQNIFDGTWEKTPTMGWMFVPLTEYQGGGKAATIEPLKDHLGHYESRLANLFGAGVQACYRGPRLFDTPETQAVVKRWVDFYKAHRAILDSDLIHLRRPDGRDWDGWLHVNPDLPERALAFLYNPLPQAIRRKLTIPLYYAGLRNQATIHGPETKVELIKLNAQSEAQLDVEIPAKGRTWISFRDVSKKE